MHVLVGSFLVSNKQFVREKGTLGSYVTSMSIDTSDDGELQEYDRITCILIYSWLGRARNTSK